MREGPLRIAVEEAERFLNRVRELPKSDTQYIEYGKEAAAVKRASLDLTRALATLRRREQS